MIQAHCRCDHRLSFFLGEFVLVGEALNRLLQAVRLDREAFVWMDFNDRATADGFIFVVVTRFLILLGGGWTILGLTTSTSGVRLLVQSILNALIFWLTYSGITYAIAKFLLDGSGQFAVFLRMSGFAYPTLLLVIVTSRLGLTAIAAFILGSVWFMAVVTRGVTYEADLPVQRSLMAAAGGLAGWIILALILKRGLI